MGATHCEIQDRILKYLQVGPASYYELCENFSTVRRASNTHWASREHYKTRIRLDGMEKRGLIVRKGYMYELRKEKTNEQE